MNRKEIQKRLLESLELKIGDKIKVTQESCFHTNKVFVIKGPVDDCDEYYLELENSYEDGKYLLSILVDNEWKKLKPPLSNKKCKDVNCDVCPFSKGYLNCRCYVSYSDKTLGELFIEFKKDVDKAEEEIFGAE